MKYITGDLVKMAKDGKFDVIVQGCNCFCKMGSGIAKQIREEFPNAWEADQCTIEGDKGKLGTISVDMSHSDDGPIVINAYTQFNYGYDGKRYVKYKALRRAFFLIKENFGDKKIGIPKIGAGLAGGDWWKIERIIDEEMDGSDLTCVVYDG